MITFLEEEHCKQLPPSAPIRCARVEVVAGVNELFELHIDLAGGAVVKRQHLKGKHSYIDASYMKEVEMACMANEDVQREIRLLALPPGASVIVEPWTYATDGMMADMSKRVTMV